MLIGSPDRCTYVSSLQTEEERAQLQEVLKANADVFAWVHSDMTGISPANASHKLNVLPSARPVQQRVRCFYPDHHQIIQAEVDNLLKAGFIREVKYLEWLANVVVVPKKGGKWRVCVDYTDLNDACPKDSFPLPRIDHIVDALAEHGMLSFLDAFFGYHQIPMYPPDAEKTSFIIPSPPPPPPPPPRALLLQRNVIWVKECQGHLPKTGNQDVSTTARENYGSVYR